MLVSFTPHGKGSKSPHKDAQKAVGYLMADHDHTGAERAVAPVLMSGDPDTWSQIVGYGNHAGRYTSGSLNFAEANLSDETLNAVMEEFEQALLPGLDTDQYSALWVKHEDKGRTELHFLIAGEELRTGNRLNTYYHNADMPRIDAWKTAINIEYGFSDPNEPERKRAYSISKNLPKDKQAVIEQLNQHFANQVDEGMINNRSDVLEELKQIGLEVARETKTSISIANPNGGPNIRLKGAIYGRDFKATDYTPEATTGRQTDYTEARESRAEKARQRYDEMHKRRAAGNQKRYQKSEYDADLSADPSSNPVIDDRSRNGRGRDFIPTKQGFSYDTPRPNGSNSVRSNGRDSGPESMQTTITKKGDDNDEIRKANDRYYEDLLARKRARINEYEASNSDINGLLQATRERERANQAGIQHGSEFAGNIKSYAKEIKKKSGKNKGFDYQP